PLIVKVPGVVELREGLALTKPDVFVKPPVMVPAPKTSPPVTVIVVDPDVAMLPPSSSVDPPVCVNSVPSRSIPDFAITLPVLLTVTEPLKPPPEVPVPPV